MSRQEQITRDKAPKYTELGFKVMKLPKELDYRLKEFWNSKKH